MILPTYGYNKKAPRKRLNKVLGTENPADMNTKGLNAEQIDKYIRMLRMEHREGRADLAPEMHELLHQQQCNRFNSTSNNITKRVKFKANEQNEKNCVSGIEEWKCPTPQKCKCNDILMYCQHSKRYYK